MRRLALAAFALALSGAAASAQDPEAVATPAAAPDPPAILGPPHARPLSGAALDEATEAVAGLLRCPVCQGLSVADSPATMAQNMKAQVRDLLAAGYDRDQILAHFERSYGEFVRLEPPLRGVNWLVWLAPLLGLLAGGLVVAWALRAPRAQPVSAPSVTAPDAGGASDFPGPDSLPDDPKLAAYVRKVREQAYGWPGGLPPREGRP